VPPKPRPALRESSVVLIATALFALVSLYPWRQLVGPAYAVRFALFAVGLAAVCLVLTLAVGRWLGRRGALPATIVSAAVLLPVWFWNRVGGIDVVLVVLDSFRADHSSSYGYERRTTPHLDAFAREHAVLFPRFFAQSAGTDKSTPAILAGILPSMFYDPASDGMNYLVPDRFPLLSEHLLDAGYETWGFSSNPALTIGRGYDRGFETFDEIWKERARSHALVDRLERHLAARGPRPTFAFAFILDPHADYAPLPAFDVWSGGAALDMAQAKSQYGETGRVPEHVVDTLVDHYDGEILEVDDALGGLIAWLEERGRLDRTMLIVTSDHGEKFGEHGEFGHSGGLWDAVIHVPMFWHFPSPLRFPSLRPTARVYPGLACHVDILPTLLGFLGERPRRDDLPGLDLVPMLYGRAPARERTILSEELIAGLSMRSLRNERYKAMSFQTGDEPVRRVLIDLLASPDESVVLGPDDDGTGTFAALHAELERLTAEARRAYWPKPDEPALDDESLSILRELGYTR
jgi:arylsulfatase A-like enzyme